MLPRAFDVDAAVSWGRLCNHGVINSTVKRLPREEKEMNRERETVLNVTGMTCSSCVRHVDHALRELEGVKAVEVKLSEGRVVVKHDAEQVSIEAMIEVLREEGYEGAPARG
jgi:copper chaperone